MAAVGVVRIAQREPQVPGARIASALRAEGPAAVVCLESVNRFLNFFLPVQVSQSPLGAR
jgi:hypothetical protein